MTSPIGGLGDGRCGVFGHPYAVAHAGNTMTLGVAETVAAIRRARGRHLRVAPGLVDAPPARPAPRPPVTSTQRSRAVAAWLEYFRFGRTITPIGVPDVVFAERGLARVDAGRLPVGIIRARRAYRPASRLVRYVVLVSSSGFTAAAVRWADRRRVALFLLGDDGMILPIGAIGRRLLEGADRLEVARSAHHSENPSRQRARPR